MVHHFKPKLNQGSVWAFCFSYGFFAVGADGGLCRERLLTRVGSVVGFHAIGKQTAPWGWVVGFFALHPHSREARVKSTVE